MHKKALRIALIVVFGVATFHRALGQTVSFGVITGAQLTDDFHELSCPDLRSAVAIDPDCPRLIGGSFSISNASQRFIIGPTLNIRVSPSLSLEVDALHREIRSHDATQFSICIPDSAASCPILLPVIRTTESTHFTWEFPILAHYRLPSHKRTSFIGGGPSFRPAENREQYGLTAVAGIEMNVRSLQLRPALRYTHWWYNGKYPGAIQDQVQLVVGIGRPSSSGGSVSILGYRASLSLMAGWALNGGLQTRSETFTDVLEVDPRTGLLTPTSGSSIVNSNRTSPVIGVTMQIPLNRRLSLDFGGLYRPFNAQDITTLTDGSIRRTHFTVLTWEFPFLLKYKVPVFDNKPFVEVGPSLRAAGNLNGASPSHFGITAVTGVELRQGKVSLMPSLRFTHWQADSAPTSMSTHLNQAEFVVGVRF